MSTSSEDHDEGKGTAKPGYKVGYGNPPVEHRFQKGQSGNPSGKRKPTLRKEFSALTRESSGPLWKALNQQVQVRDGGRAKRMSAHEALYRKTVDLALKGDRYAHKWIYQRIEIEEAEHLKLKKELFEKVLDYHRHGLSEIEYRKARNSPEPKRIPDPRDMVFDYAKMECRIDGPTTVQEKVALDEFLKARSDALEKVYQFIEKLEAGGRPEDTRIELLTLYSKFCKLNDQAVGRYMIHGTELQEIINKVRKACGFRMLTPEEFEGGRDD